VLHESADRFDYSIFVYKFCHESVNKRPQLRKQWCKWILLSLGS